MPQKIICLSIKIRQVTKSEFYNESASYPVILWPYFCVDLGIDVLLYHWWLFQTLTPFAIIKATLNQMKKESYLNWQLIQIFLNSKISIQERTYCSDSKTLAYLPSLFHLEVLLMAFHSSNAFEKIKMAENIFSTLSNVSCPPVELNSTQLVCWSLLTAHNIHTNLINQAKK